MAPPLLFMDDRQSFYSFNFLFFNRPFMYKAKEQKCPLVQLGGILLELIRFIDSFSHGLWMIERILCFCLNNIMMIWIRWDPPPLLSITVWCSLSVTYWSLFTLDNKITPPSPTRRSNLNTRNGACLVITLLILRGRSLYPWRKYLSWFTMTMTKIVRPFCFVYQINIRCIDQEDGTVFPDLRASIPLGRHYGY